MKVWEAAAARLIATGATSVDGVIDDLYRMMSFLGLEYPLSGSGTLSLDEEAAPNSFESYVNQLFRVNPVVFGAELVRKAVFCQARFRWRNLDDGKLHRTDSLGLVERPWPGGSSAKLLTRLILHADGAGNGYVLDLSSHLDRDVRDRRLTLMRPDWVVIVLGSRLEPDYPAWGEDAELLGYLYMPPGTSRDAARFYLPNQVAHFAPIPDPAAHYRGMSWMTPIIREAQADRLMGEHKLKFFEQGATPNIIIKFDDKVTIDRVRAFKELLEEGREGLQGAYKTMYLGGGGDPAVVGTDFRQIDFSRTQGKAETRILQAAGVHPVIAGSSEGMQGASLNAGNFAQVRRIFSDIHLQDLWFEAASSLESILQPPAGHELVLDGKDIPFLQQDQKDQAEIQRGQASAITTLVRDGFTPDSAVAAVTGNDMSLLEHTGRVSVQLHGPADDDDVDVQEGDS